MDIGSAFTYVFDDEDWIKKLAIGGGVVFLASVLSVVVIGLALFIPVLGYMLKVLQNVRDGHERPLPEWSDFGGLFQTGLFVFLIGFVYNIPSILLICATNVAQIAPAAADLDADIIGAMAFVATCLGCLQFIVGLVAGAILPAAIIRYAKEGTFASAFQFGEIFSFIKDNIGDYVIVILLSWIASFISAFGVILCVVGVFFTVFWSFLVSGNLYGQLARKVEGSVTA